MKLVNLEQGSPDWLLWRESGIGSSEAPIIMGASPWKSREKLLLEKQGLSKDERPQSSAMARGHTLEPIARSLWEAFMGLECRPACGVHNDYPFLKGSFDGINLKQGLVLEIKAPNRDDHFKALDDHQVPTKYFWQVQHLLLVSGLKVAHYVSYSPQQPDIHRQLAVVPVVRDGEALKKLLEEELSFWGEVQQHKKVA